MTTYTNELVKQIRSAYYGDKSSRWSFETNVFFSEALSTLEDSPKMSALEQLKFAAGILVLVLAYQQKPGHTVNTIVKREGRKAEKPNAPLAKISFQVLCTRYAQQAYEERQRLESHLRNELSVEDRKSFEEQLRVQLRQIILAVGNAVLCKELSFEQGVISDIFPKGSNISKAISLAIEGKIAKPINGNYQELNRYIANRILKRVVSQREYNLPRYFFSCFKKQSAYSASTKISAAQKLLSHLQNEMVEFTEDECKALQEGSLFQVVNKLGVNISDLPTPDTAQPYTA